MARYLLQSGVDQPRGSMGGSTFQRCGRVFAIRKRNVPVQKKTAKQTTSNNRFESFASRWKLLNNTQKNTWSTFGPQYQRTDSLGNLYTVQRQALRIGANIAQFPAGASIINSLVAKISATAFVENSFVLDRAATSLILSITAANVQANCKLVYFVGTPAVTQNSFTKADCIRMGIRDSGQSTTSFDWYNTYITLNTNIPQTGLWWCPVFLELVQKSSGQVIFTLQSWFLIEN